MSHIFSQFWTRWRNSRGLNFAIFLLFSLKPMYSFGKWWKSKVCLMGFVYRVVWVLKPCESFCLKPPIFWENCINLTFSGCPRKFCQKVMYIAPSSGHISLNSNMPFKVILRRCEVVFWCLEWECCTFWKTDGNAFKSTTYPILHGKSMLNLIIRAHKWL